VILSRTTLLALLSPKSKARRSTIIRGLKVSRPGVSVINLNSTTAGIIHVNFYDELDHKKTLRQVIVDNFPVQLSTTVNGSKKYSALLSKLIPAVIKNDSPIKGDCDSNPILCLIDEISLELNGSLPAQHTR
jgi:hypothetical protein